MNVFENHGKISYLGYYVTDITKRVAISDFIKEHTSLFEHYIVKDGETPEIIAFKAYKDPQYHWVIMLTNDIIDPFHDWVMSVSELEAYVLNTYGSLTNTHHWEYGGEVVDSSYPMAAPISNLQYEERVNEAKRKIKILKPEYIPMIEEQMVSIFNREQ